MDLVAMAKLYNTVAVPLYPSKEHRAVSFRSIFGAMGAEAMGQHAGLDASGRRTSERSSAPRRRSLVDSVISKLRGARRSLFGEESQRLELQLQLGDLQRVSSSEGNEMISIGGEREQHSNKTEASLC